MRVLKATEENGLLIARVEFPDGMTQTVRLPAAGCQKGHIYAEAVRLRKEQEQRDKKHTDRTDLLG